MSSDAVPTPVGPVGSRVFKRPGSSNSSVSHQSKKTTSFDARHMWVFAKVAEAFGFNGPSLVESFAAKDGNSIVINNFFKENGTRKLLFFYQPREKVEDGEVLLRGPPRLMVTTGETAGLRGKAAFFLRTSSAEVPASKFEDGIIHGVLEKHLLEEMQQILASVIFPALTNDHACWGQLLRDASVQGDHNIVRFREQMERFVSTLTEAWDSLKSAIDLDPPEQGLLDGLDMSPASYNRAALRPDLVAKLDVTMDVWCKQIETVLAASEQVRQETDDVGPNAELEHWKSRMAHFTKLTDQIKSKQCKIVVGVLTAAKSKTVTHWKELDNRVTDAANEAKDNVKYLYTLEKFTEPLYKGDPLQIQEAIPGLVNAISIMHNIARYYNTSEHMTALFIKITNQMIIRCKHYLTRDGTVWKQDKNAITAKLHTCIELNEVYQDYFRQAKMKMATLPNGKNFEFSEVYIFGKFDLFCQRLDKIVVLVDIVDQFSQLQSCVHVDGVQEILIEFKARAGELERANYDLLDHRVAQFDEDFGLFQDHVHDLEGRLRSVITDSFRNAPTTEHALNLLDAFSAILQRDSFQGDLDAKYMLIFNTYGKELAYVKKLYERYSDAPPVPRNTPPVAGKIAWSRQLLRRIEKPMAVFQNQPQVLRAAEAKPIIRMYNRVASALIEFETLWFNAWLDALDVVKTGLQATLLVRVEEADGTDRLHVNFDFDVLQMIKETTWMLRIGGLDLPDAALLVKAQDEKFKGFYESLSFMLQRLDDVKGKIDAIYGKLMLPLLEEVDARIAPGLASLTWNSMNIEGYLASVEQAIVTVDEVAEKANDIIAYRINETLRTIGNSPLVDLGDDQCWDLEELARQTRKFAASKGKQIELMSQGVETAVHDLVTLITSHYSEEQETEDVQVMVNELLNDYDQLLFDALVSATTISINSMRRRILTAGPVAFFKSECHLNIPSVTLSPSIDEIIDSVGSSAQGILAAWEVVMTWGQPRGADADKQQADGELVSMFLDVSSDKDVLRSVLNLVGQLEKYGRYVNEFLSQFDKYHYLWIDQDPRMRSDSAAGYNVDRASLKRPSADQEYQEFLASNPTLDDYETVLKRFAELEREITALPKEMRFASWQIDVSPLLFALKDFATEWKQRYASNLIRTAKEEFESIDEFIDDTSSKLVRPIEDLDDVRSTMAKLLELRECEVEIVFRIRPIEETYALLTKHGVRLSKNELQGVDTLAYKWQKLMQLAGQAGDQLSRAHVEHKSELLRSVDAFVVDVATFKQEYDERGPMVQGIKPRVAVERLKAFERGFKERDRKYEAYHNAEELFGLPHREYPEMAKIRNELRLLDRLYSLYTEVISTVGGYEDVLWSEADFEVINTQITEFQTRCRKLPKGMKEWEAYLELRAKIDDFCETLPLMDALSSKAMRPRHWQQVMNATGVNFSLDLETFKLKNVMDAPLLESKDEILEITNGAVKEAEIEVKLKSVQTDWTECNFLFAEFKSRGLLLLRGLETADIMTALEDSQMLLGTMMGSRYIAPFKGDIEEWQRKLATSSEVIEQWLQVQALWVYLEAVFSGGDIAKQLPQEAKRFMGIDKQWNKIMTRAASSPNVVDVCYRDDMVRNLLPHLMEQLELCQKSLSGYLETKRALFPRFYFVSDPVLLEILGQGSDPNAVQPHLQSIFMNIATIYFDEEHPTEIVAMESAEMEKVPLSRPLKAEGNVETWLGALEVRMQESVKDIVRDVAIQLTQQINWANFIPKYPAQAVLLGCQFVWTAMCEEALTRARSEKGIMTSTLKRVAQFLAKLTDMTTGELTKNERTKLETLVTIQVHQRDVFDEICKKHVRSATDFEWTKQTRFYWRTESDDCVVSITEIDFPYCYEYLGCTERLVITPLTDRCYITLAQALGMYLGGAPAGPAGTGKTETVKDMGKALGKFVVVLNCSDQMDYRFLGKTFKGLAQSGAWGCFDEFNRIELEVLSVVAQQVACVLAAMRENSGGRKPSFVFTDGATLHLYGSCGFFITMNPGYAGRQELPENLKTLFRSVSMMVPDRQIIMRVKLASQGFQEAYPLAKKFAILYRLCEEQLSKQRHYDFGLRNILSVLRTAGQGKRQQANMPEPQILMRTLRDMNLSKLVDDDEPLFLSLIDDLFPELSVEKATFPLLEQAIEEEVARRGLVNAPDWNLKILQLYETSRVRHGIMVLGPSGSGKTSCIRTLMNAMTAVGEPHVEKRMNPKSITAHQMFGRLDVATNDWTDGIFAVMWRWAAKQKKSNIWICLDGPVDALWIENLNTVLDENKLLTLANADRIPMTPTMKMIFEVENLNNASPATVSRAGMIYMAAASLGWEPVLEAWLGKLADQETAVLLRELYQRNMGPLLQFMFETLTLTMHNESVNTVGYTIRYLEQLLIRAQAANHGASLPGDVVTRLFVFAVIWGTCGTLETDDQARLDKYLREETNLDMPEQHEEHHQAGDTVFEYMVDPASGQWRHWASQVPEYAYPNVKKPVFSSIIVPTVDNTRVMYLMQMLAEQRHNVLLIGQSGTAKTVTINAYLSQLDPDRELYKNINFSHATTPQIFQRTIEGSVEKRQGHTYGPAGGRRMSVFVDDLNMPEINEGGDQTTNEIVRTLIEDGGFYNLDQPGEWTTIKGLQFLAAMSQPGGGKNDIPNRLKRHFVVINCTVPSKASVDAIFGLMAEGHFSRGRGFKQDVVDAASKLAPLTRELWQATKNKMLPTPAKFHYVFNLRDLSRIFQGMLRADPKVVDSPTRLLHLWHHECDRVLPDRFTAVEDKQWFAKQAENILRRHFTDDLVMEGARTTHWVDFLTELDGMEIGDDDDDDFRVYEPVEDMEVLRERLEFFQQQFNEDKYIRGTVLDLVLFEDAMVHLMKISRIIRTKRGNALLVGVGGSGKQSLARLASYIAEYSIFQIQVTKTYSTNNFIDDLKELYKIAGARGQPVSFLFTDAEVKEESFLEYINNILSSGEVSNLFAKDEMDMILHELRPIAVKERPHFNGSMDSLYKFFIDRVRDNLHVVLCFSPTGGKFRERAMKFPGLVNGCTIDWFAPWPKEALLAVAERFMEQMDISNEDSVKASLVDFMAAVHAGVSQLTIDYFNKFRRYVYVTPKSFLSFISSYTRVYAEKRGDIEKLSASLTAGLEKLATAGEAVAQMKIQLEHKERELAEAGRVSAEKLTEITENTAVAEKKKAEVQAQKDELAAVADDISKGKAEAERDLEAARPALEAAEDALLQIKPNDISVLRKLANPPNLIKRIMDGVLLLRQAGMDSVKIDPQRDEPTMTPSWKQAVKLMSAPEFLKELLEFPRDNITDETVELLQPYLNMADFNFESAQRSSGNVAGLCNWIKAMCTYHDIAKEVAPKRARVFEAEQQLALAMAELDEAQAELDEKQAALDAMQAQYDAAVAAKQRLTDEANLTKRRMDSANSLIEGLSGEKERWTQQSNEFQDTIRRLVGDVAIGTAFLSYSGAFNEDFRKMLNDQWTRALTSRAIPFSRNMSITKFLTTEATIGDWNLEGLPTDELSIQNGILVTTSDKYPLLVDPQGQGKNWILRREGEALNVTSLGDRNFKSSIEMCVSQGLPLLIEDIDTELDPLLDNLLEKQFIKVGRMLKVQVGDLELDYDDRFRLYITTKLPNPHYAPEICARTAVIDFTVTIKGLESQLLGRVLHREQAGLEEQRQLLLEEVNTNKKRVAQLEADLLHRLTHTKGNLVDDDSLIEVLANTKLIAEDVAEKLAGSVEAEKKINTLREEYRPVATRGSIIYFLIAEMSLVNAMYQTSLAQFLRLFDDAIQKSAPSPIPSKRITNIIEFSTFHLYQFVSRGLFETHKSLFVLQLCLKIHLDAGKVSAEEYSCLLKGGAALDLSRVRPKPFEWIPDKAWLNLAQLCESVQIFKHILEQVERGEEVWKRWFDLEKPEQGKIPDGYERVLGVFHRLLLVRCWREDRTILAAQTYITSVLDERFVNPIPLDLEKVVSENDASTPIIFILSAGSDPTDAIAALAHRKRIDLKAISMGQGQEKDSAMLVQNGLANGGWVLLQNCHLGLKFMATLEMMMSEARKADEVHDDFRVWITAEPDERFPIGLLQASIKLTNEPPQGVKAGLKRSANWVSQDMLDATDKPQWRPLLYTIMFLHTTVQERRKFGALGWNIPYEFNQSDLSASVEFIKNYLYQGTSSLNKGGLSWSSIRFMVGEVMYGGRITDDFDRVLMNTYCEMWLNDDVFKDSFRFAKGYTIPPSGELARVETLRAACDQLPLIDSPEVFGLNANADLTYRTNETTAVLGAVLAVQPRESGNAGGMTREDAVLATIAELLGKLPDAFVKSRVKGCLAKLGVSNPLTSPLCIFLAQEIDRMQIVIQNVHKDLTNLQLAIEGAIIMSSHLSNVLDSLFDAQVPDAWAAVSWPSSTLGFWFADFVARAQQLNSWLSDGRPRVFWLGGFFNPQGFLTSVKQEVSRKNKWALDSVVVETNVLKEEREEVRRPPEEGVLISGLFLDGAAFSKTHLKIVDAPPKVLFHPMPVVHVGATNVPQKDDPANVYMCPVYKSAKRTDLNYIFSVALRTPDANITSSRWIVRGAALTTSTTS